MRNLSTPMLAVFIIFMMLYEIVRLENKLIYYESETPPISVLIDTLNGQYECIDCRRKIKGDTTYFIDNKNEIRFIHIKP